MKFALSALCIVLLSAALEARYQNVTVSGIAVCNKRRLANVLVELYDRDTLDPNDLLSSVHTNAEGEFTLTGGEDEVGSIEPFIRVTHTCNTKQGCHRQSDYEVPKSSIDSTYDMTYVTLDIIAGKDKEKCD